MSLFDAIAPRRYPARPIAWWDRARSMGRTLARIWGAALDRPIRYGGDDLAAMEQRMKGTIPSWHAMDLRLMLSRYQMDGTLASATDLARMTTLLGRAPGSGE